MPELVKHADSAIANEEDIQMTLGIQADVHFHFGHLDRVQYEGLTAKVLAQYPNLKEIGVTLRESHSTSHNGWSACLNDRWQFLVSRHYDIAHIDLRFAEASYCARAAGIRPRASCLKHSIPPETSIAPPWKR